MEALFHKTHKDLNLLLLDWSKAFDSVDTLALTDALKAFGITGGFLKALQSTFKSEFSVMGQSGFDNSDHFTQEMGIRQGCPLSPLLFIIMLSWLMEGVDIIYNAKNLNVPVLPIPDIFYADDTILLSTNPVDLQTRFSILEELAAQVCLHMNRDKTTLI